MLGGQVTNIMLAVMTAMFLAAAVFGLILKSRLDAIERENSDAARAADWAELGLRDCLDSGGVWDFRASVCRGPENGDR
jgi:hypothetical protein